VRAVTREMEMSEQTLIISFADQSESYVLGFEAGLLYQRLDSGEAIEDYSVHANNAETLVRIAKHFGFAATLEATGTDGWSTISLSRGRPKLSVV
jgi:hypothetical protein